MDQAVQCYAEADVDMVLVHALDQEAFVAEPDVFKHLAALSDALPTVLVLDQPSETLAVESIQYGAQDVLSLASVDRTTLIRSIRYSILRHQKMTRLRSDAQTDPLTGLFNRRNLPQRFGDLARRCVRCDEPMSLALFDLDHFKAVNDHYGHVVGDEVLRWVGQIFKSLHVVRLGGEEFAILMPGQDLGSACQVVESVLQRLVSQPVLIGDLSIQISASAGVVNVLPADRWKDAYVACDALLLDAKSGGRNRCRSLHRGDLSPQR